MIFSHHRCRAVTSALLLLTLLSGRAEAARPARATAPGSAEKAPPRTLTVAAEGGARYKTIGAALKVARAGDRIVVQEGVYRESLVLERAVEIVGEGSVTKTIIETAGGNCVQMRAASAAVRNFTLRAVAGEDKQPFFAVDIPQGRLVLENCDITSTTLSAVAIHGKTANPEITNCRIYGAPQSGVWVYADGRGTLTDCDIRGNAHSGIDVQDGGDPTVRKTRIRNGRQAGVFVHENGKGTFEECDITANGFAGVTIRGGATPLLRSCRIRDNKESGVWVYDNGLGRLEKCEIVGNTLVGLDIQRGGNPTMVECRIASGKKGGVFVHDNGAGTLQKCRIESNALTGVEINRGGNPTLKECRITRNAWHGLYVHQDGRGVLENCDLTGNPRGATWIATGCQVRITPPPVTATPTSATGTTRAEPKP